MSLVASTAETARRGHDSLATVLVVDDEAEVRELIGRWLGRLGVSVLCAGTADDALDMLAKHPDVAVAFCDARMPGRSGAWLAGEISRRFPETAVVIATGMQDAAMAADPARTPAVDQVLKPFGRERLKEALDRGLNWHAARLANARERHLASAEARQRADRVMATLQAYGLESARLRDGVRAVADGHPDWFGHVSRVAGLALRLARRCSVSADELAQTERACLLHEIGAWLLPAGSGWPPGDVAALTARLLGAVPALRGAADIVRARWEHFDGSGRPLGLRGASIPLGSRLLAVADTVDALVWPDAASAALPPVRTIDDGVVDRLRLGSGKTFDPVVVDLLARLDPRAI